MENRVVFTLSNGNRYYVIFTLDEGEDVLKYVRKYLALRIGKTARLDCKNMDGNMAHVLIDNIVAFELEHQFPKID